MQVVHLMDAAAEILGHNDFSLISSDEGWHILANGGDGQTPAFTEHYAAIAARAEELDGPQAADVIAERERRLGLGFDYDFDDERGVHRIGTTPGDMVGWDEVTKFANAIVALGDTTTTITIVTETGPTAVTALEWQAVLVAAGMFRQPIWQASFMLQAADPIPADYADDAFWP